MKPPRNHTSIYFTDYLKGEWKDFSRFITAKGFTSFNSYVNNVMTEDYNTNYAKLLNMKSVTPEKRMDIYNDTQTIIKEKLNGYSDGELLDLVNITSDFRNILIRESKRRGLKI